MPFVPKGSNKRVLDIGCGAGVFGAALKQNGIASFVLGLELDPQAALVAKNNLDQVYALNLDGLDGLPAAWGKFDLIVCLDVLEHVRDPWKLLKALGDLLQPNGHILLSIPNVRNFRIVLPLVFLGKWTYADSGLLDRTHLRFFTRDSVVELVQGAELRLTKIGHTGMGKWSITFWANLFTLGLLRRFFELQYVVCAQKK